MVLAQLRAHWRLKLLLTAVFNILFWSGYEFLGHHAFFPLREIPLTCLDRIIPYQPQPWGWVYLSQFSFTSLLPWFLSTRNEVLRCSAGLVIMSVFSFAIFLFFPVAAPIRTSAQDHMAMTVIAAYDGSLNCFPSLHAAFLCYMAALGWRLFGNTATRLVVGICVAWGASILYATIATRQHYALDLAAGAVVGCLAYWLAWRGADSAAATTPRNNGAMSREGLR